MRRGCLITGVFFLITLGAQTSEAQFTSDFQTNIISGVTSNWSGDYVVGSNTFADALLIQNSAVMAVGHGYLGLNSDSSNNCAVVSGSGSIWTSPNRLYVGWSGSGNSVVVSNGGHVSSGGVSLGASYNPTSSNNSVLVTGPGSVWSNTAETSFAIGGGCASNNLVISNGGKVVTPCLTRYLCRTILACSSALVSDPGSVWNCGDALMVDCCYTIEHGSSLVISNGGQVVSLTATVGDTAPSNIVVVTGTGSVWNCGNELDVGYSASAGNRVVVSEGGHVVCGSTFVGLYYVSTNNYLLVTDPGSALNGSVYLGGDQYSNPGASGNSLVISNGGQVVSGDGTLSSGSTALVTGSGSLWNIRSNLWMTSSFNNQGLSNSLVIAGGSVSASNSVVGVASAACNNFVELDSGSLIVTDASHNAALEIRSGQLILNGGVLQADTLVITNSCAQFVHTGGTLIVGKVVLDPNTFRIVSVARQTNDILVTWMMGPGASNTLQAAAGDGSGGYSTNGFTDIFVVTNNTTVGTITNYLDLGAATNTPARYYRARLVP
jgi:T5SS/PEP-CTERM-associated repeat protein